MKRAVSDLMVVVSVILAASGGYFAGESRLLGWGLLAVSLCFWTMACLVLP